MTNGNNTPKYELTAAELQQLFDSQAEHAGQARALHEQAAEWPTLVQGILKSLADRVQALEARVAALTPAGG